MNTRLSAILAIAATLVVTAPVFAAPTNTTGTLLIADIGRDTTDLAQNHEVLPTISDLNVDFPEVQKSLGFTGTTLVALRLDENNKLVATSILTSCGNKFLDTQAKFAVQRARFQSGTIAGKAVAGEYSIRVDFGNPR